MYQKVNGGTMNILILILTIISLVLNIILDIISLKSQKKMEKFNVNSELEITYTSAKTRFVKHRH